MVKRFFLILLYIIFGMTSYAQKVALVLSGGGAKGTAHIGVLRALEENNIPIDYIAGTSMGAIIGGLYAAGYSPDEIEKIITSPALKNWTTGEIDEKYVYYFKKPTPDASWIDLKFDYDSSFKYKLPTNIISPFQMDFDVMEIFSGAAAAAKYDFDSLFIPFRCVASDIAENKAISFKEGNLGQAIRASMTYPFYFKPIRINGRLMFDGGMYNNFPSDIVYQDFFPDIIIGSKVASNYGPPKDDDILSQIQSMLMSKTNYSVICENGILIEPTLEHVNVIDFSKANAFIDSGYIATIRKIKEIRQFVYDSVTKEQRETKRKAFTDKEPPIIIDNIYTSGLSQKQSQYVINLLQRRHAFSQKQLSKSKKNTKRLLTVQQLKSQYFRLLAEGNIESIYPDLKYNENTGFYDLNLNIKREKNITASLGGNISSTSNNEGFFQLRYNYWRKNIFNLSVNSYFGRFYSSLQAKARADYPNKTPFYIESDLTYNVWDYYQTTNYFFNDNKTPSFLIQNEFHFQVDGGIPVSNTGKLEAGGALAQLKDEYYQKNYFSKSDTTDRTYFYMLTPYCNFEINTLNRKQYADKGVYLLTEFRYINGEEKHIPGSTSFSKKEYSCYHDWVEFKLKYDNYYESIGRLKLGFYAEVLASNQPLFDNFTATILAAPAFQPTPDSKTLFLPDFRSTNYAALGLKQVYLLTKSIQLRLEGYVFQPYQEIVQQADYTATFGKEFNDRYFMGMAAFVYHSPIGPLSLSLNAYDRAETPFSLIFNFGYIIFNKKVSN